MPSPTRSVASPGRRTARPPGRAAGPGSRRRRSGPAAVAGRAGAGQHPAGGRVRIGVHPQHDRGRPTAARPSAEQRTSPYGVGRLTSCPASSGSSLGSSPPPLNPGTRRSMDSTVTWWRVRLPTCTSTRCSTSSRRSWTISAPSAAAGRRRSRGRRRSPAARRRGQRRAPSRPTGALAPGQRREPQPQTQTSCAPSRGRSAVAGAAARRPAPAAATPGPGPVSGPGLGEQVDAPAGSVGQAGRQHDMFGSRTSQGVVTARDQPDQRHQPVGAPAGHVLDRDEGFVGLAGGRPAEKVQPLGGATSRTRFWSRVTLTTWIRRQPPGGPRRLVDRCEWRFDVRGQVDVVEADDADVAGDVSPRSRRACIAPIAMASLMARTAVGRRPVAQTRPVLQFRRRCSQDRGRRGRHRSRRRWSGRPPGTRASGGR